MQPTNQAERKNAFFNFLLFFIFTIIILIVVIFFSVKVPFEENDKIRQKMLQLQSEKAISDSFTTAMKIAMSELLNYNEKTVSAQATKQRVQYKIDDMNKLIKDL